MTGWMVTVVVGVGWWWGVSVSVSVCLCVSVCVCVFVCVCCVFVCVSEHCKTHIINSVCVAPPCDAERLPNRWNATIATSGLSTA